MILNGNNLFYLIFYFVGQFVLLSLFLKVYLKLVHKNNSKLVSNNGISVLAVQYIIDPNVFFKFNLFEIFITSLIIILAAIHLYNLLSEEKSFIIVQ
jgi:hypothetical protein